MAKRRMFSLDVINTDKFISMPASSRACYFELGMRADDDGFIGNPMMILRGLNYNVSELEILIQNGFVIPFNSGVIVITHWKIQNKIPADRYIPTTFCEEKKLLEQNSNSYKLIQKNDYPSMFMN